MPKITYVHPNGTREVLDVPVGTSVMRGAILNSVDGIVAECGGEMMCATCHVYVEEDQLGRTPTQSDDEKAMLEFAASERRPHRADRRRTGSAVPAPAPLQILSRRRERPRRAVAPPRDVLRQAGNRAG